MKALVILAHPNIEISRVNKRWKQELLSSPEAGPFHLQLMKS
jgi:putative NADPH-quinone reductase